MDSKEFLNEVSAKEISSVFKEMLRLLEDMKQDHDFHYQKLYDNIPKGYHPIIDTADHFTDDKVQWIRKRILDSGNGSMRNMEQEIENFEVKFIFKDKY